VLLCLLNRVKRYVGRAVSNGMNGYADAQLRGGADGLVHCLCGKGEDAAVVGVALESFEHGSGLRTEGAIGKDFDATDAQHVISHRARVNAVSFTG